MNLRQGFSKVVRSLSRRSPGPKSRTRRDARDTSESCENSRREHNYPVRTVNGNIGGVLCQPVRKKAES